MHSETPLARLVRSIRRSDETERRIINVSLRIGKVCVVRRVERFRTELQFNAFRQHKRAEDTQISLKETWTTQTIPSHRAETRAGLRRPCTIRGAIYSEHRVVEPCTSARATLRCGADSSQRKDRRIELPRHLTAAAREQVRRTALYHIDRQSAHPTHDTANLEATEDRTRPAFTRQPLSFAEW